MHGPGLARRAQGRLHSQSAQRKHVQSTSGGASVVAVWTSVEIDVAEMDALRCVVLVTLYFVLWRLIYYALQGKCKRTTEGRNCMVLSSGRSIET